MIDLKSAFRNAITSIALETHGLLQVTCADCREDIAEGLNCPYLNSFNGNSDEPVLAIREIEEEFNCCPAGIRQKIHYSLYQWINFLEHFKSPLKQSEVPNILWFFICEYEKISSELIKARTRK